MADPVTKEKRRECKKCHGIYYDPQPDGSRYVHTCSEPWKANPLAKELIEMDRAKPLGPAKKTARRKKKGG
jgi:hypothetical protein